MSVNPFLATPNFRQPSSLSPTPSSRSEWAFFSPVEEVESSFHFDDREKTNSLVMANQQALSSYIPNSLTINKANVLDEKFEKKINDLVINLPQLSYDVMIQCFEYYQNYLYGFLKVGEEKYIGAKDLDGHPMPKVHMINCIYSILEQLQTRNRSTELTNLNTELEATLKRADALDNELQSLEDTVDFEQNQNIQETDAYKSKSDLLKKLDEKILDLNEKIEHLEKAEKILKQYQTLFDIPQDERYQVKIPSEPRLY